MLIKLVKNKLIYKEVENHMNHLHEFNNFVRNLLLNIIYFEFYY